MPDSGCRNASGAGGGSAGGSGFDESSGVVEGAGAAPGVVAGAGSGVGTGDLEQTVARTPSTNAGKAGHCALTRTVPQCILNCAANGRFAQTCGPTHNQLGRHFEDIARDWSR